MTQILIPINDDFVELVAKSIAKDRFTRVSMAAIGTSIDLNDDVLSVISETINNVFTTLWSGNNLQDEDQRNQYREDARAAIRAINLKLLTDIQK